MIVAIVVAVMVVGVAAGAFFLLKDNDTTYEEGVLVDFGDHTGQWIPSETNGVLLTDAVGNALQKKELPIVLSGNGVLSVNGREAGIGESWGYWTYSAKSNWTKITDTNIKLSNKSYLALALTKEGKEPLLPCLDALGNRLFSGTSNSIVSLSAVASEILCKVGKIDSLVAVDYYSNYPAELKTKGLVKEWGFYATPPTAEIVGSYNPDFVVGEEGNHDGLLKTLNGSGIRCLSLYQANTLEAVYKNIWMIGAATGQFKEANETILKMQQDLKDLLDNTNVANFKDKTAVILMGNEWYVAAIGHGTFIDDVISRTGVKNEFPNSGWIMDKEYITTGHPDIVIFIADEDMSGKSIKDILSTEKSHLPNWPNADGDTWAGVTLYCVDGESGDMFLRAGPRIMQALSALLNASPVT
jgi:iron complex transport system substrate-binding protein